MLSVMLNDLWPQDICKGSKTSQRLDTQENLNGNPMILSKRLSLEICLILLKHNNKPQLFKGMTTPSSD